MIFLILILLKSIFCTNLILNINILKFNSQSDFYTIIDLPEGTHQFKFFVDGQWMCDKNAVGIQDSIIYCISIIRMHISNANYS